MGLYLEEDNNMGFMDKLNATASRKKTGTPKVGVAQNAVTNHSYTQGKSRVQGNEGAMQGNQGWKSQYTNAGAGYSKQINPIINSLSNAPTYDAPKIEHKLTSQEGFNEALGVVGARNNAKLASQNQRVLQGVLGSLVSGDSQNRATASRANIAHMADATDRRGQDMTATSRANTLVETANRNKMLGKYYDGQNAIGSERNRINRDKIENATNTVNQQDPAVVQRQRLDAINNGDLKTLYGDNVWASMDGDQKSRAKSEYASTGRIKDYESDNWLVRKLPFTDAEFRGGIEDGKGTTQRYRDEQQPQATTQNSQPQSNYSVEDANNAMHAFATGVGLDLSHMKRVGDNFVYDDGEKKQTYPIADIMSKMGK